MDLVELMSWETFVRWLTNPGAIPIVVGAVLSVLAEYVAAYQALAGKWKRAVFFGVCVAIPALGAGLGILTLGWSASWVETFWPSLMAGVLAFASGTLVHLRKLPGAPELPVDGEDGGRDSSADLGMTI